MQTIKLNVTVEPCPMARQITLYPSATLTSSEKATFIYNELVKKFGDTWVTYTIRN